MPLQSSEVPTVHGVHLDDETRCLHYNSPIDIIAIKMACCDTYYACKGCHEALANHDIQVWPRTTWDTPAILCGVCKSELTIAEYMQSNNICPNCASAFNPVCRNHYHFYFETEPANSAQ